MIRYVENAAAQSRYNAFHWFKYMRKLFDGESCKLSEHELDALLESEALTLFQKVTLKRAVMPGTKTHEYVVNLNKPARTSALAFLEKKYDTKH